MGWGGSRGREELDGGAEAGGPENRELRGDEVVVVGYSWAGIALCKRRPSVTDDTVDEVPSACDDCQAFGSRFR